MKKYLNLVLIFVLVVSLIGNIFMYREIRFPKVWNLSFPNANSWDNYFSVHDIKEAQKVSTGKGIKVGILDHYFGCNEHLDLYAGNYDFLDNKNDHDSISEHGYWMACTLKEIAPDVEIYALSTTDKNGNENNTVQAISRAVDWAIENHIDILSYSDELIKDNINKSILDKAVVKAHNNGILITFIHYDNKFNIKPTTIYEESEKESNNLTIYPYDYNVLLIKEFKKYGMGKADGKEWVKTYYSESSMSKVMAGFLALLKERNPNLSPEDYKAILINTVQEKNIVEPNTMKKIKCKNVVNINEAIKYMDDNYK